MNYSEEISRVTEQCLEIATPSICRVKVSPKQVTSPRARSRQTEDGGMETAPMEYMWPPLKDEPDQD